MPCDFKLDDYGDLDLSTGDLSYVREDAEVAQLMETKTMKIYGEDAYAPKTGIKWFGTESMYDHLMTDDYRKLQLREAYQSIPEITSIPVLTLSKDAEGKVEIAVLGNTIYGTVATGNEP